MPFAHVTVLAYASSASEQASATTSPTGLMLRSFSPDDASVNTAFRPAPGARCVEKVYAVGRTPRIPPRGLRHACRIIEKDMARTPEESHATSRPRCAQLRSDGLPCKCYVRTGSEFCYSHDPAVEEQRRAWFLAGVRRRQVSVLGSRGRR